MLTVEIVNCMQLSVTFESLKNFFSTELWTYTFYLNDVDIVAHVFKNSNHLVSPFIVLSSWL